MSLTLKMSKVGNSVIIGLDGKSMELTPRQSKKLWRTLKIMTAQAIDYASYRRTIAKEIEAKP